MKASCAMMRHSWTLLFLACVVMAFHFEASGAQFSFSLPGKWGNGKRAMTFSKRADCGDFDPEALFNLYKTIQVMFDIIAHN